jgi:hypothetical protein
MTDYTKNARTIINKFLWDEITNAEVLDPEDYRPDGFTKSIIPIIPAQQTPEMNNLLEDLPYIIYDYQVDSYGDEWWICEETILYTIVATSVSKISEISEFMIDLFRRKDLSGKDLQVFNTEHNLIKFYSICLESVSSPEPFDSEGGRMSGQVEITYKYSRFVESNGGRFS